MISGCGCPYHGEQAWSPSVIPSLRQARSIRAFFFVDFGIFHHFLEHPAGELCDFAPKYAQPPLRSPVSAGTRGLSFQRLRTNLTKMESPARHHVVFFDQDCLLCNSTVRFLMARDHRDVLRFAPLQGPTAGELFKRHPKSAQNPEALKSLILAEDHDHASETISLRSAAVARVLRRLGGFWGLLGILLGIIPRPLRDWGYDFVARHRIRWFGVATSETCPLPTPEQARKLLP